MNHTCHKESIEANKRHRDPMAYCDRAFCPHPLVPQLPKCAHSRCKSQALSFAVQFFPIPPRPLLLGLLHPTAKKNCMVLRVSWVSAERGVFSLLWFLCLQELVVRDRSAARQLLGITRPVNAAGRPWIQLQSSAPEVSPGPPSVSESLPVLSDFSCSWFRQS